MSLRVHTARLGAWSGPSCLNITRKSGHGDGLLFAPSWEILNPAREGLRVANEMRQSYRAHREAWERLLAREEVTLTCYCTNADLCHRTILAAAILLCLGATYEGERPLPGEAP